MQIKIIEQYIRKHATSIHKKVSRKILDIIVIRRKTINDMEY